MLNLWFGLPIAALLVGIGLHFGLLRFARAQYKRKAIGSLSDEDSPPAPGRRLIERIERVRVETKAHWFSILALPVLLIGILLTYHRFNTRIDFQFLITSVVACGIVFCFCLWHLIQKSLERKRLQSTYDADVEVGQALQNLAEKGYHVFHGLATDNFEADHVIVGPKGVFLVKTKAASQRLLVNQRMKRFRS